MQPYLAEFLGTMILVLLGDGVVANVVLTRTKGEAAGWIVITMGWGMAVFVAVLCVAEYSGAHINPAVTISMAAAGKLSLTVMFGYVAVQILGAMLGAALVYIVYRDHYYVTKDADAKLATFCTSPNIRSLRRNLISEIAGTFVLIMAVLLMVEPTIEFGEAAGAMPIVRASKVGLGAVGALPIGLVVLAIGLSLGGTTGYAINPARDFGPRLVHALLPIPGKRDSDWGYAWVPVAGPILGGLIAVVCWKLFSSIPQ